MKPVPWRLTKLIRAVLFTLVIAGASTVALAQLYTGSITGVVTDPSGAVVPNAQVTLTDTAKGYKFETTSDATGRYLYRALQPSTYKLTVKAAGFATAELSQVVVNVNQNASANVTLQIGKANEAVEVVATTEGIQTQDAAVGQVVNSTMINALPLVGRQVYDLAFLAPGVSQATGKAFGPGGVQGNNFVSQGSRNAQADVLLDGVSSTNYEQNTGFTQVLYTPSPDSVQEFKIQQTNFGAEFGFSGATIMNVVTRSGDNQFHGSAYEYWRNNILNSQEYFSKQHGDPNPAYHWNNFGGTVGGPIKKDKAFFFFAYDGSRTVTPTTLTLGMPTNIQRGLTAGPDGHTNFGNFGEVCTAAGGNFDATGMCSQLAGQLYNPTSHAFIPYNNLGTAGLVNPVAQAIVQGYIPRANIPGAGLNNNFLSTASGANNNNQFDSKVDWMLTGKDNLSVRFSHLWGNSIAANLLSGPTNIPNNPFDANTQGPVRDVSYQGTVNWTHTFSPTTLLTTSLGLTHNWTHTQNFPFDETSIGLPANIATGNVTKQMAVTAAPAIQIDNYTGENGNANFGGQPWDTMLYGQDLGHLSATLSHVAGRHELKTGFETRLHRINFTQYGLPAGKWQFQRNGTSLDGSGSGGASGGDSMASFFVGYATGWNAYQLPASPATQNYQYAGFFQDNWRVTEKLTLNLGIRYDLDLPRTERYNRMSYFDPAAPSPLKLTGLSAADIAACPACANLMGEFNYVGGANPKSPYKTYYGGIGPRFGFAYNALKNTVIRGGFGVYYDPSKGGAAGAGAADPGGFQGFSQYTTWGNTTLGQPVNITPLSGNSLGHYAQLGGYLQNVPISTYNVLPREWSWSLGVQHELPWKIVVQGNYIGKKGDNLYMGGNTFALNHLSASDATMIRAAGDPATNPWMQTTPVPAPLLAAIKANTGSWSNPFWSGNWYKFNGLLPFPMYSVDTSGYAGSGAMWGNQGLTNVDPPIAYSNYHGLTLQADKRFSNGLQFMANYTAQKSMDNASIAGANVSINGIAGATLARLQDPNNLDAEYSLSQFDIAQIAQFSGVYQLPFGKGKKFSGNGFVNGILGGMRVSGTYRWDSGLPVIVTMAGGLNLPTYGPQRPNLNAPLIKASGVNLGQYFADPGALSVPQPLYEGTAPRVLDTVRIPGTNNFSLSADKDFKLTERMALKFRWEAFNLFNHVQFAGPNTAFNTADFGKITAQANQPRIQQLSLRVSF
jgi:hypothetical protein